MGDLARELHVTERFVRRLIADGELAAVRVGTRTVRIRRGDLGEVLHPVLAGSVRRGDPRRRCLQAHGCTTMNDRNDTITTAYDGPGGLRVRVWLSREFRLD